MPSRYSRVDPYRMPSLHLHYHACAVCEYQIAYRKPGEKGLKMCPCREVYYCGSEHQKIHWPMHKISCYTRIHKAPLTPMDHAVQYLMQFHEASLVEIAVAALWKEDVNCDMRKDFETKAVVLTIEPRESLEDMEAASAAGRIPPFQLSRTTSVVLQEEEARRLGSDISIFEHPFTRTMRMRRDKIGVAMIFQPSGRIFTQAVPKIQLAMWEMGQGHEKKTTNPPMVYWHVMMTNGTIKREIEDERKKKDEVMQVASSST